MVGGSSFHDAGLPADVFDQLPPEPWADIPLVAIVGSMVFVYDGSTLTIVAPAAYMKWAGYISGERSVR